MTYENSSAPRPTTPAASAAAGDSEPAVAAGADRPASASSSDGFLPLRNAARFGLGAIAVVAVASVAIWFGVRGVPGLWGALMGSAVGGGFMLATLAVVLWTRNASPNVMMGTVLGSWLAKGGLLLVFLLVVRDLTFYDRAAFGVTVILTLVVLLATETLAITRTRTPYVS